ncbi:MAG: hypothetical protein SGCHY_003011 [Lobulomycetales sp.]
MLTMQPKAELIPELLTRLIDQNLPQTLQSKHFVRYCQRLLSSKFVTSLHNSEWDNMTRDIPPALLKILDSDTHFAIVYFILSIAGGKLPKNIIQEQPAVEKRLVSFPAEKAQAPETPILKLDLPDTPCNYELILSSTLYSFIGIPSSGITFDSHGFKIREIGLSVPSRDIMKRLLKLSYLYEMISRFVKEEKHSGGSILQSFCSELLVQLNDYYR